MTIRPGANVLEQDPLFVVESHLLHNFNPKLWGSIDLRYRYGGETTTDGVANELEMLRMKFVV
jgi:hypothetical protein